MGNQSSREEGADYFFQGAPQPGVGAPGKLLRSCTATLPAILPACLAARARGAKWDVH